MNSPHNAQNPAGGRGFTGKTDEGYSPLMPQVAGIVKGEGV